MSVQAAPHDRSRTGRRAALSARQVPSLHEIARRYDVRAISPRKMAELSAELYLAGFLTHDQYADLAYQSELMPNYDVTIGALTGTKAAPDRARDYTRVWKAKLQFETKHLTDDPRILERTRKILELLRTIESAPQLPMAVVAEAPRREAPPKLLLPHDLELPPIRLRAAPGERW